MIDFRQTSYVTKKQAERLLMEWGQTGDDAKAPRKGRCTLVAFPTTATPSSWTIKASETTRSRRFTACTWSTKGKSVTHVTT